LSDSHWIDLGANLKKIHTASLPRTLKKRLRKEDYSHRWRDLVRNLQNQVETEVFDEPLSADLAAFMRAKREVIERIVFRAGQLANDLRARKLEFVLCHGDLHPGNLFLSDHGAAYIVDWDDAILAPKEHDLMLLGAGMGGDGPQQEELFYKGYGPTQVDRPALTYYRYVRIVLDLAAFGDQVFSTRGEGEDRAQAVDYFKLQFSAGNVVESAIQSDES
jgi:spectinomycin phosphotransferase